MSVLSHPANLSHLPRGSFPIACLSQRTSDAQIQDTLPCDDEERLIASSPASLPASRCEIVCCVHLGKSLVSGCSGSREKKLIPTAWTQGSAPHYLISATPRTTKISGLGTGRCPLVAAGIPVSQLNLKHVPPRRADNQRRKSITSTASPLES